MDKYLGNDRRTYRCVARVMDIGGFHMHQCLRKGVVQEVDPVTKKKCWWCKQHAPSAVAQRDKIRQDKWDKEHNQRMQTHIKAQLFDAVHAELLRLNDACKLSQDVNVNLAHTRKVLATIKRELNDM